MESIFLAFLCHIAGVFEAQKGTDTNLAGYGVAGKSQRQTTSDFTQIIFELQNSPS